MSAQRRAVGKNRSPRESTREGHRLDADEFDARAREHVASLPEAVDLDAMAAVFSLLRLANRLIQDFEREIHRPSGWSWAGFRVMFSIWVSGPLPPHAIAHLAGVSRGTTSSVLNTLERDGLVERRRESDDRRVVTVRLSRKGRARLRRAVPHHNRRESEWVSALGQSDQRLLAGLLHRLLEHHPQHRGGGSRGARS